MLFYMCIHISQLIMFNTKGIAKKKNDGENQAVFPLHIHSYCKKIQHY